MSGQSVLQIGKSVAGGILTRNTVEGATTLRVPVFVEGFQIAVLDARIFGHGIAPHSGASQPRMVQASSKVFARRKGVCRVGDLASCGHAAVNGASTVFAG